MQTGDDNNQQVPPRTSDEITGSLWRSEALYDRSMESNDEVRNYLDVVRVLSEVELPSPSPVHATSCTMTRDDSFNRLHQGQSSGTKDKADDIEGNNERQRDLKNKQRDSPQHGSRRESTKTNITEKRRRNKISERIRTLQTLIVPNCNKELNLQHLQRDKASILSDAIEYIKSLQMQVQMVQSMGTGHMSQGLYMTLPRQPSLQVPNLAPNFTMSPLINMQHGIPQFGSYVPVNYPIFPTSFSGFRPPMEVGTRSFPWSQPRPDLYPPQQQRFPSQSVYSTTPSLGTIIPTTYSQGGSMVPGQPLYHVPTTSDQATGEED